MESEEYMQQSVRVQIIQSGFWLLYLDGHLVHSIICNAAEVPPGGKSGVQRIFST